MPDERSPLLPEEKAIALGKLQPIGMVSVFLLCALSGFV